MFDEAWLNRHWIAAAAVVVLVWHLLELTATHLVRAFRLRQARRFKLLHGGKPRELFTSDGDLVQRPPRPPGRFPRTRGDDDAA